ncbi:ankyrin repeat and fibronectin type-III domain-containing protein 1-like isoform X2 [Lytechinus variegatus]|uniref:ankyrin repeat and fibronectin type-III domain-containing protein 1-like isoform X2 n=1 Tax=Lytechinus variegatus TaxID=7654 RepID=UPI001BB13D53|nr:ankyrin repeat and fibronectin type-III domain-containing protein 1-like isoform X2 [Lytechinus variegatus]
MRSGNNNKGEPTSNRGSRSPRLRGAHERWLIALKKVLGKNRRLLQEVSDTNLTVTTGAAWRLEDDEEGYLPPTPSLEDTPFSQTSSQLYYPVPPRPTTPETDRVRTSNSNGGLAKLARRLSQRGERRERGEKLPCRQRSVSVDSGDVRKAHSMESLVPGDDKSKSSSIPPSPLAPNKLQRSLSGKKRGASTNEVDSTGLGGSSVKDKGRRNSKYISDLQALFEAVEHQDLDAAKYCLEANGLDLNQPNPDEFTVLDIAVMTNNMPMSRLLLSHGARENPRFLLKDVRLNKLNTLINEAEQVIQDLTTRVVNGSGNNNASSSSSIKDADRQLVDWEWRYRLLKRMKTGFEQARVPDIPAMVRLYTASSSSLLVTFEEPLNMNGAAATRFKIEWSQNEDFCPLAGEHILYHFSNLKYTIQGLTQGAKYYVRVSAFNMKGFGPAQTSNPPCAVPSCWRDVDGSKPRSWGRLSMIDELFQQVRDGRPADSAEIKSTSPRASPNQMRKTVRKSLKNLFQSAPKFQKHLRRGVYLASVIYNEDKVLVTTEDYLPIIEVDENFPSNVQQDFLWFMKVAQTWEDVDLLRTDLNQSTAASPVVHFRGRLLQAAAQLQSIMSMQDLGKLYYEPVKDSQGIVIFTLINSVKDPRTINNAALKWVSMTRVQKRKSMSVECPVAADLLLTSLPEKIIHHQVSSLPLSRGLYVGYLKLRSSLGNIRIQVPERHPSMLPHIKVRDNYNVSQEEWDWLHSLDKCEVKKKATRVQEDFQRQLASATRKLLTRVGVTEEEAITHRLCDLEVVELSSEVSFILLLPPLGSVCIGPGTPSDDWIISRDFTSISVPVFEMIHMSTYHGDFIRRYARLSSILETESLITQQQLREAFSNDELNEAKRRQTQVDEFQKSLDMMWRGMRWIMDILQYARDKQIKGGVPLSVLYAPPPSPVDASEDILATIGQCMKDPQNHTLLPPPPCSSIGCQTMLLPVEKAADKTLKSGILRVFPAYNSGLAKGTSVKLHVTSKTSCEDIVSLVVQQLNKAMESSGMETPAFSPEDCAQFCLVAIIANKEYSLQEDFCPLQLQNPWTKGQLFVRPKDSERAVLNVGPSTDV